MNYIHDSLSVIKKFINKKNSIFIENFGIPNYSFKDAYGINNLYWIGCSVIPKLKNSKSEIYKAKGYNMEATRMIVAIDSVNIIRNIRLITP